MVENGQGRDIRVAAVSARKAEYIQDVNIALATARLNNPDTLVDIAKESEMPQAMLTARTLRNYPDYNVRSFLQDTVVEAMGGTRRIS